MVDYPLLAAALLLYGGAWTAALRTAGRSAGGATHPAAGWLFGAALAVHTLALAERWMRFGHGPFTTLHEILSSNLWSLSLVAALAAVWWREVRATLWAATPVWAVLALWLLWAPAGPGHLPPTYDTSLLYIHTVVGKLYLGLLLVATALGALPWLRRTAWGARWCGGAPADLRLDRLAYGFAAFAFVFDTLMLIVGAVWAQDAWGRYWAWDPLESWAFATWIALAAALHARGARRLTPAGFGLALAGVFTLAFLTFFGVPFLSLAPHKGAV